MNRSTAWNDLPLLLAIGRSGSLSGAARDLGVSHATIFRRLRAAEARFGVALFHRTAEGYVPTVAGESALAAAEAMEARVADLEREILGRDLQPGGTV